MELRGFDQYEVRLGDEMRGERASLGKSLSDAERDLRIKAFLIAAIEDCDAEVFPNKGLIPGYVRSYARYLGMDADDCYEKFCSESGFRSAMAMAGVGAASGATNDKRQIVIGPTGGDEFARSRFATPPAPTRIGGPVSFGGIASALAVLGVVSGLTYGGYALLQDVQRIGFEPLPEAPAVVAETPLIRAPEIEAELTRADAPDAPVTGTALVAVAAEPEVVLSGLPRRDGPISAINPATSGVFLQSDRRDVDPAEELGLAAGAPDFSPALRRQIAEAESRKASQAWEMPEFGPAELPKEGPVGVSVLALGEAWIRVRGGGDATLFEGVLAAGQQFDVPARARDVVLRAGNAGSVFVLVDGIPHGPVGKPGRVVKGLALNADQLRADIPVAERETLLAAGAASEVIRAAAISE